MIIKIKIVVLILILPLLLNGEKLGSIKQLFNVRTVTIDSMTSSKKQINYGYIVADESRVFDIYARFDGYVTKLYANTLYKNVTKGEPLVEIYSPEVYRAKEDYIHSLEFDKRKSSQMVRSAKLKLELLGVEDAEIEEMTKSLKADEFTTIYAPQSGWIFQKGINQGSSLDKKKRLFTIINTDKVWAEVSIFQNELADIESLESFDITIEGVKKIYKAQKNILYPIIKPKQATATLRLIVDNAEHNLQIGMYIKVASSKKDKTSLVIPSTATIRKDNKWYAFLATPFKGEYEPLEIEIEPLNSKFYRVTKGVKKGDIVVNNALFMMDSDAQINGTY